MNNPLISVIIPVYNTGKYLFKCLDSIINQTYRNLEIIIVDDGSTDESSIICDGYALKDDRIRVIHKENEGVSKARNTGIAVATGDFFHFPDSDDYIENDTYEYLLDLINKHNCDMINYEYFVNYPNRVITHKIDENKYGLFDKKGAHSILITDQAFAWNKFFSKEVIEGVNFREDILRGEDCLFAHYAIEKCEKIWFDVRPLYHYVQSEDSACRGHFRISQLTALKLYDAYKEMYYKSYPDLWQQFLYRFQNLMIMLYYDMYADDADFSSEMKRVIDNISRVKKEIDKSIVPNRTKIKFAVFYISPRLYCKLHKIISL